MALPSTLSGKADHNKRNYDEAFEALDDALLETGAYLAVRKTSPDREKERALSQFWMDASRAVAVIDPGFASVMGIGHLGWTSPDYWNKTTNRLYQIKLADIENTRSILNYRKRQIDLDLKRYCDAVPVRSTRSVTIASNLIAVAFGIYCIYGGIWLMTTLEIGGTTPNFLGLAFPTKQAGLVFIALGAATLVLIFRKLFKIAVDPSRK